MFAEIISADIDHNALYQRLWQDCAGHGVGAIVTFTGLVRDYNQQGPIDGIELEHYPGMTEQALKVLLQTACQRFELLSAGIVHRVGKVANHEQIVWVGSAATHRQAAFDSACYMMDTLKQAVPLWKREFQGGKGHWVEAKDSDHHAALAWMSESKHKD